MPTDDTERTVTSSALGPRAIFCVPVARWQQATVCVGVWAGRPDGRQIISSIVVPRSGNRRARIWNVTPSEPFSFFSLTIIIAGIVVITDVMNAEDLTTNISYSYLGSLQFLSGKLNRTACLSGSLGAPHFTSLISHREKRVVMYQLEYLETVNKAHFSVHRNSMLIKNPTRCNSMQIFIYCKVTLHVSGVTAPIIRSTKNCNRNLGYSYFPPTWPDQDQSRSGHGGK